MTQRVDLTLIGQIVSAIGVLPAFISDEKTAEFTSSLLTGIPGCRAASVCLRRQDSPIGGVTREQCRDCVRQRKQRGDTGSYTCGLVEPGNLRAYPIETVVRLFGYVILDIDQPGEYDRYEPFAKNLVTALALTLENRWQQEELQAAREDLEQQVEVRTAELRESEARFRAVVDTVPAAIRIFDGGRMVFANGATSTMSGYSREEIFAPGWRQRLTHPDDLPAVDDRAARRLRGEPVEQHYESRIVRKDGQLRWLHIEAVPVTLDGRPVTVSAAIDITDRKLAEEEVRRMALMADTAPNSITVHGFDGGFFYANQRAFELHGYSRDEFMALRVEQLDVPVDQALLAARMQELRDRGEASFEVAHFRKDGTTLPLEVRAKVTTWGGKDAILSVATDISARKLAEDALRESEEKYRTVADFTYDWEAWRGPDGAYRYVSPSCERISGHTPAEFMANPKLVLQITHPDDRSRVTRHYALADRQAKALDVAMDFRILAPGGETRWISHRCAAVFGEGGNWLGRRESNRDTTSRKLAEEQLAESRKLLQAVIDGTTDAVFVKDLEGRYVLANAATALAAGKPLEEILGRDDYALFPAAEAKTIMEGDRKTIELGSPRTYEEQLTTADGQLRTYLATKGPVFAPGGNPTGIFGVSRDITDRKLAEDAIRESEARFRILFDRASDGIALLSLDGELLSVNESFARMHGYSAEEMLHWNMKDLDTPKYSQELPDRMRRMLAGEALTFDVEHYHRDGHIFPIEVSASLVPSGGKPIIQGFHRDITDRKLAEDALRDSEARFRAVVETVPASIRIYEGDRMVFANEANSVVTGYSPEEILAPGFMQRLVHPEDLPGLARREARRLRGEPDDSQYTSRIVRKDGQVRWIVGDAVPITFDGRPATLVTSTDITDRKQAEEARRKLDLQAQDAQKLESLGVLAGGIAHDFNNLLTTVLGNASLALMELSPESPTRETIESIEVAARRAADLTAQMLAYSGRGHFFVEPLNLPRLVEEMGPLLGVVISPQSILEYHFAPNTPLIEADSAQIRQVVMSLITNASEATGDAGGVISISTGMLSADRAYLSETYLDNDLPEGDYAFVEVTDTGPGMDEETRLRIFEPFFTTKFTGRGLGLAAVLGIVRGHRGAIKVSSEVGLGATFTVLFPVAELSTSVAPAPATKLRGEPAPSNATILVVDDDATVRTITSRILGHSGYTVIAARDGNEALVLFQQQTPFPDLVLLDMTMPGMDGRATFRELRRIDATARIILMSGFSEADAAEQFEGEDLTGFVQKPFLADDLLAILGNALAASPATPTEIEPR